MTEKGDQPPDIPPSALTTAQQMTEKRDQPPAAPTPAPRSQIDDQMPDMQWRPAPMATSTPSAPDNRTIHPEGIQDLQPRRPPPVSIITVMDQVRKWALRYDGSTNPLLFAERIEELTATHQLPLDLLPKTMPIVLTDKALLWYRNNNKQWNTWALFKKDLSEFFLPRRYWDDLDDQVRRRKQRPGESFKDFVLAIQDIMRPAKFPEEVALERIFLNSAADYQLYIRKTDFQDLQGLIQLAEEFERIQMLKATSQPKPPVNTRTPPVRSQPTNVFRLEDDRIDVRNACRRCGQPGHYQHTCNNPRILYCWMCGRKGVRTIDCCRPRTSYSGNEYQSGSNAGAAGLSHTPDH